jgi:hypothetical protein
MTRVHRERASFKSSEILGLFLLSFFGSMFLFALLTFLGDFLEGLFGA